MPRARGCAIPRNGTGIYTLPQPAFTAGSVISSAAVNSDLSDIASALTASLPRDGQVGMTGQLKVPDGSTVVPAFTFTNATGTGFSRNGTSLSVSIAGVAVGAFAPTGYAGVIPSFVGIIVSHAGSTAPSLWLLCFGQAVSRTTFAALFAVIGTAYGAGDGSTTFNVPDLRGSLPYGADNMGGSSANRLTTAFYGTDPTVLGDRGGIQSKQLVTANLPPYTPAGTNSISDPTHVHSYQAPLGGVSSGVNPPGNIASVTSTGSASTGVTSTFNGSAQGGTSTAFALLPPGVIVNKIIYTGV